MRVYKVIGKYTGMEVLNVFANTMHGAKIWFTRNAKMGLSSSYVFIGRNEKAFEQRQEPELTIRFEPVAYAGLFHVYVNDVYIALADFDRMHIARDGKLVDFPHGYEYMFTELLDHKYVVTKGNSNGIYNIMNMDTHMLVGKIEINSSLDDIQYYPISVK